MPWTKEQAIQAASKGGKAKAENQRQRIASQRAHKQALVKALSIEPADASPERLLELRIARLTRLGARPVTIDRLTIALARLRKSGGSRRREVQASPLSAHNISYSSVVAPQGLTQSPLGNPPSTQPVVGAVAAGIASWQAGPQWQASPIIKESLLPGTPPTQVPPPPALGLAWAGINSLSTSTQFPVSSQQVAVERQAVPVDGQQAPWAPLAGAVPGPVKFSEKPKPEAKELPCPGPGYVKVKVGSHWVWGKHNG